MYVPFPSDCEGSGSGSDSGEFREPVVLYPGATPIEPDPDDQIGMLMALIGRDHWPLQVCGDPNTGVFDWDQAWNRLPYAWTPIDRYDPDPNNYPFPGVGVTAYSCQLGCRYNIVGDLTADVILGKIDGQYHILKILNNATTIPVTGRDIRCRCCGHLANATKYEATITSVTGSDCLYDEGDKFQFSPGATCEENPLGITIGCNDEEATEFEDIGDWLAFACNMTAEILDLDCCLEDGSGSGPSSGFIPDDGSGSGGCTFYMKIRTQVLTGCDDCQYDIEIRSLDDEDPCAFQDEPIEDVIAEACGLHDLEDGTRVILIKIPLGLQAEIGMGSGPLGCNGERVEWFVIRACDSDGCADPCDQPGFGPPCCGILCTELMETVSATLEYTPLPPPGDQNPCDCNESSTQVTLDKNGDCRGSSSINFWELTGVDEFTNPYKLCEFQAPNGADAWSKITEMRFFCNAPGDECYGGSGSGSVSSGSGNSLFGLEINGVAVLSNPDTNCCDPMFAEFDLPDGTLTCESDSADANVNGALRVKVTVTG